MLSLSMGYFFTEHSKHFGMIVHRSKYDPIGGCTLWNVIAVALSG